MKDFWKMLLAVLCGLLLFGFIISFIAMSAVNAAIAASEGKTAVLPRSGVLAIDMSTFQLTEQTGGMPNVQGNTIMPKVSIYQAAKAIKAAAEDPGVQYIYLKTDGSVSSGAAMEEFRKALAGFRTVSGKPVIAYIESPSSSTYWLASVADKVYMTEYQGSTVTMTGVSMQSMFLKDLLDKIGVNVQLIRHGKYKSAGEMFTRNAPSPENTLQYQTLVNSVWGTFRKDIAVARGISEEALDEVVNNIGLCLPEDFLKTGLADDLVTRDELKAKLATLAVKENFNQVAFMPFPDYAAAKALPNYKAKQKIAVIYAEGNIVDGHDVKDVAGDRFTNIIDKVRADSSIKAVVLRVNSPGGSVLASEKIKHELDLLGAEKPLVASFGEYAASGGYWISNNCSKIFTDAVTLTGSIGVFGMVPDFSKTTKNVLGINVSSFSSNKHGDMYGLMRPFDSAEYAYMLRSIETIYDKFTAIVSEGRGIAKERVDEIGQGRVWTGADAIGINLADEIGTLEDAIAYAAISAGIFMESAGISEYPAPLTPFEEISMMLTGAIPGNDEFVKTHIKKMMSKPQVLARLPYEIKMY